MYNFQHTLAVIRQDEIARNLGSDTLAVIGPSRGGTSMLAYTLFNAGVFLGRRIGIVNYEDADMLAALDDDSAMRQIISDRNAGHRRWGFKIPSATFRAGWLAKNLRNPVFVIAYRNPVAIARSIDKRDPGGAPNLLNFLFHGLHYMTAATGAIRDTGVPAIFVDVDRAITEPTLFLTELADVLGLSMNDPDAIANTIAGRTYRPSQRRDGVEFRP